jgi:hypothetical protein
MQLSKFPNQWVNQVVDLYIPKTEHERRSRAMSAVIILIILAVLYYFST